MSAVIRSAKTSDVKKIRKIIDTYAVERKLLSKETVTLFESVQEFIVAEVDGEVVGCGALHVLWEDIAEVRTVFCLTFETKFFGSHGFAEIQGAPVDPEIYAQLLRSYDEGIAEFLDLESVKPNTLGNTRMLKIL
jgi:amino-acid N-acetyltransferase